jgi:hypothetical protein
MNILVDLIELVFIPGAGPETPRGWLVVSLVYGFLVACVLSYTLLDPPSEAGTATFLAFLGAPLGMLYSGLHSIREPKDRRLGICTLVVNGASVVLAVALSV